MASLGNLVIEMSANVARLQSDLGKAVHLSQKSADQISRAFERAQSTIATLGVGLSVAGLISFVKSSIDAAAQLDDLAEKTGASVEELSKLSQIARISGTDMGVVSGFLIKLNKALHETDEEAKGANRALSAIGLTAEELRSLDPAVAMKRIADELNKFADGGGKTAAVLALTGKSAAEALPFLRDLATEVGISAKVTAEQAAQAEELQKAYRRLGNASTEASQALARDLVPWLSRIVEQMAEGIRIAGGFGNAIITLGTINPFKTTGENIKGLGKEIEGLEAKRAKFIEQGRTGWIPNLDAELSKLKKQAEFVKMMQRQEALGAGGGRGRLDSKDIGPAGTRTLDFMKGTDAKKGGANPYDAAIKQLEQEALKVQDLTRFEEVLAGVEAGRYGKLLPAQKDNLLNLAAAVDIAKEDTRVQKEAEAAVEKYNAAVVAREIAETTRLNSLREQYLELIDPLEKYRKKLEEIAELTGRGLLSDEQSKAAVSATKLTVAQAEFNKVREEQEAITSRLQLSEERIQNSLRVGAISEIDALKQTGALRKDSAAQLDGIIARLQQIATESNNPALILQADQARAALEKLRGEADLLGEKFNTIINDNIATALDSLTDKTKSATEKVKGFFEGLSRDISKLVNQSIATDLSKMLGISGGGGAGGGIGGFLATLFGGAAGAGAAASAIPLEWTGAGFAEGTDFVPRTGLAMVHRGEEIIPANENRMGSVIINVTTPDASSFRASRGQIASEYAMAMRAATRRNG